MTVLLQSCWWHPRFWLVSTEDHFPLTYHVLCPPLKPHHILCPAMYRETWHWRFLTHQRCAICPAEIVLHCLIIQPNPLIVLSVCCDKINKNTFLILTFSLYLHLPFNYSLYKMYHTTDSQFTKSCSSGVTMLTRWALRSLQRFSASTHTSLSMKWR